MFYFIYFLTDFLAHLFLQLKRVYDVLSDHEKKSEYDRYLMNTSVKRQRVREMDGARKKARDGTLSATLLSC